MNPADIYVPFGVMLGVTATYALFWTLVVQKVNPFKPACVEEVLAREFNHEPGHAHASYSDLAAKLFELFRADRAPSGIDRGDPGSSAT